MNEGIKQKWTGNQPVTIDASKIDKGRAAAEYDRLVRYLVKLFLGYSFCLVLVAGSAACGYLAYVSGTANKKELSDLFVAFAAFLGAAALAGVTWLLAEFKE